MLLFFIIGLAFYVLASISMLLGYLGRREALYFSAKICSIAAFCILTFFIFSSFSSIVTYGLQAIRGDFYLLNLAWFLSLFALFTWYKFKTPYIFTLASPLFFLIVHTAMLTRNEMTNIDTGFISFLLVGHIAFLTFALACLLSAGIAALLFLIQERALKKKKKAMLSRSFLSLQALDKINLYATEIGFPFYTLGLLCGFGWASIHWGFVFSGDIKEIFSIIIWLGYVGLFYMRLILKLSGKKPAYLLLFICALSIFSLFGINTLFDTHHNI